ncbi:hypothetical protein CNAG_06163 [Cryptococcus neoformans var. grubii H99]|uniref:C2H2-type domain-containing protein n=1 Tax=Cryptococcus neoformans (strain H99 / ATCC 208821 / CBS 10515 / FGSC 9487) TaxID=235443 RepID=J9W2P9_CRYN9|nr:hypothetical protein CNAG_06163 [Cryptococcus neoformans var. grubii H99]AFR98390.2 hypothetical protein CNAG_06163 [Cryptococcus neoformans var. grubii H99]AUB28531.1 hypothetical protein CKF44_06163 [Cryptococcus neoformans var. grubii]|eukprot:XP_012053028.1 hypothetical protein CNAG_06163 [Cryptococcus neoformans var. grubii H99]
MLDTHNSKMPRNIIDEARDDYDHHYFALEQPCHYPTHSHQAYQPEYRYYHHPYARRTTYAAASSPSPLHPSRRMDGRETRFDYYNDHSPFPPPLLHHPRVSPLRVLQSQQRTHKSASAVAPASKPSSGRYQLSRGAQRDAKHSQGVHLQLQKSYVDVKPKEKGKKKAKNIARPVVDSFKPRTNDGQPKTLLTRLLLALPHSHPLPLPPPMQDSDLDVLRRGQQWAMEKARRELIERVEREKEKEKAVSKKIVNIQLQVFVHARETRCYWGKCEAILNSWAVLEKHISQSHFHTKRTLSEEVVNGQRRIGCLWGDGECQETFGTKSELHQHVLVLHMKFVSARCPFGGCEYNGHDFNQLMRHVGVIHATATPDDFIPGLVHFRPSSLPSSSPSLTHPLPSDSLPVYEPLTQTIALASYEAPGNRMKKWVSRRCRSGKWPRMHAGSMGYEIKKGTQVAIKVYTDNARSARLGLHPVNEEGLNGDMEKKVKEGKEEVEKEAETAKSKPQSGGCIITVSSQDLTPPTSVNPPPDPSPLNKRRRGKTSLVISPSTSSSGDSDQAPMSDDSVDSANSMDSLNSKISRGTRCSERLKRKRASI